MTIALGLSQAVDRVLDFEHLDNLQLGQSIRVLVEVFKPEKRELEQMTYEIVSKLRDSEILTDPEFYEGLDKSIRVRFLVRSFREVFCDANDVCVDSPCRFCSVMTSIAPIVDLTKGNLHELRRHLPDGHIRKLICRLADATVDTIAALAELLRKFFHPSEGFEVADTVGLCLQADWFQDIVPSDVEKARKILDKHLISVFPSTKAIVENFLENFSSDVSSEDGGSSLGDFIVSDESD